jgi:hypothetical protein
MTDSKIVVLEERVTHLGTTVGRVETKIDGIVDALAGIVRIEERQIANAAKIADCAADIDRQGTRISAIEVQMPSLAEKAAWIAKAVIGIVSLVGVAVVAAVVRVT